MGGRVTMAGGQGDYYTYRYTIITRTCDSCIKMGSDESHFNVSLIVRDKVTRLCPQTTTFEEKGLRADGRIRTEVGPASAYQPNALPLGQTGSPQDRPTDITGHGHAAWLSVCHL